jgi:serine/threonine-protein kinase
MLQETLVDLCPSCGERTEATAAECGSCGASLVLWAEKSSSGTPKGLCRPSADSFWQKRAERARPGGSGRAEGAKPRESGRPPRARSEGSEPSEERGEHLRKEAPLPVQEVLDYAPGELFAGRYVVIDRLGEGGMGVVYKARDQETNRTVALKMIRGSLEGDSEALSRFRREPGLAQQVTHENVCRVHDLGLASGVRYLSMEYLEADTLAELIKSLASLSVKQTLQIAVQVSSGLEAIHSRGIVHRDLKPSNIAVDRNGRVVVMDFGLARGPVDSGVTEPGVLVGSYAYLAPEHISGAPLTASADVYALGLVLYEMLTGKRPPGDEDQRPLALRGDAAVLPPPSSHEPDVPGDLDAIATRCLSWNASDRPEICEIRGALEKLLALEEARVVSLRREARPAETSRRTKVLAAAGALAVASALAAGFRPAAPGPTGVALVPFEVENPSPGSESLSGFSADGLTAGLRAAPGIRVSIVEPDLRAKPDAEILRALGAQWLLRGSFSIDAGIFSFRPELSRADGSIALRETLEGADPIESLDLVRKQVLKTLGTATDLPGVASLRTASFDAYRMYLEARSHHDGWFAQGDIEKARSLYKQALEVDPSFTSALTGQALASTSRYLSTREPGDLAVARYASERALAQGDFLPEAHIARATLLAAEEKWDESRTSFARAFELAPGDYASRRNAADLYETLGRDAEAEEIYEQLVSDQPFHWNNHYWYGGFLYRSGNLKAAAVSLERARELAPEAEPPVTLLGFCHLASGELEEARGQFEKALELRPEPRARQRLGLVYYYAHEFDRALELWSQVLSAEPERAAAHADVADALRQLGRLSEARSHYREALALYDRVSSLDTEAEAQRAQVLAAAGRCREAKSEMERVLKDHGGDPVFLYYGALTAARCRLDEWAAALVIESIGAGNVVSIWFDPDLETVRRDPRVRRPLELIGSPE